LSNPDISILSRVDVLATVKRFLKERGYEQITDLCLIMQRHGSDKGLGWHNYTPLYRQLFEPLASAGKTAVFELGIGTNKPDAPSTMGADGRPGASLRGWAEWLPDADICGADIEREMLFQDGRIRTFYVNQLSPDDINNMWKTRSASKSHLT
jgi:hypothetical protein